jgi:hypothetical protein
VLILEGTDGSPPFLFVFLEPQMQVTKDKIRSALEVLSHASKSDYDGIEAEYFATIAKLSNDYDNYIKFNIVKNKIGNFIKAKMPSCPSCNDGRNVFIVDLNINLLFFDPFISDKENIVQLYTDTNDIYSIIDFKSPDFLSLLSFVKKENPELYYLFDNHAYCKKCKISFKGNDFIASGIGDTIPFEDIISWSKENVESNDLE